MANNWYYIHLFASAINHYHSKINYTGQEVKHNFVNKMIIYMANSPIQYFFVKTQSFSQVFTYIFAISVCQR